MDAGPPPVRDQRVRPVRLTQLVLPGMRRQGWGRIVNISSMGGRLTFPGRRHLPREQARGRGDRRRAALRGARLRHRRVVDRAGADQDRVRRDRGRRRSQRSAHPNGGPYGEFNAAVARPPPAPTRAAAGEARRRSGGRREDDREGDQRTPPARPLPGDRLGQAAARRSGALMPDRALGRLPALAVPAAAGRLSRSAQPPPACLAQALAQARAGGSRARGAPSRRSAQR